MTASGIGDGTAVPIYDNQWIERYQAIKDTDAQIASAEMTAFKQLVGAEFRGVRRSAIRHLDVGTCAGRYLRWGVQQGFGLVCGIDRSACAVRFCAATIRHEHARVYCADVLCASDLAETAGLHAPFHLVSVMLGTINHIDAARHADVLRALGAMLGTDGRLVLSSWHPGRCAFSLYAESERRFLEASAMDQLRLTRLAEAAGLRLVRTASTAWHLLAVLSPSGNAVSDCT